MTPRSTQALQTGTSAAVRKYADLPGPRGLPVVGSAFRVRPETAHLLFEAWARQYGPSFRVRLGPRRLLVTRDAAVVNGVLRDRPEGFDRPPRQGALLREMGFDEGLFFANGDTWKVQRRMVMSAFNPEHVKNYFPSLLNVTARLQRRWDVAAAKGDPVELQRDLMRFTVDAIAGLAFGADVNTLESDDDVIQRHLGRIFPALGKRALGVIPYWRYVKRRSDRELDLSTREVKAAIDGFVATARARMKDDAGLALNPENLLQAMLAAADRPGSAMTDRDVAGNVLTMLLAGEDTTANTMSWLLYLLHQTPEALHRARDEIRSTVPRLDAFTPERLDDLVFLEACILETLRLKPVAPLLPVMAVRDVEVAGLSIPKGTVVVSLTRPNAVSEPSVAAPESFRPDRWLPSADRPMPAKASIPFGSGPRLCPGRYLATLEMKMAVAMLLGRFRIDGIEAVDGDAPHEILAFAMGPSPMRMALSAAGDDR